MTFGDREEISRGLAAGRSYNEIASRLGRHRSVVSREVGRNGGGGRYRAAEAQQRAEVKRRWPKVFKLAADRRLREAVARRLAEDYWLFTVIMGERSGTRSLSWA